MKKLHTNLNTNTMMPHTCQSLYPMNVYVHRAQILGQTYNAYLKGKKIIYYFQL